MPDTVTLASLAFFFSIAAFLLAVGAFAGAMIVDRRLKAWEHKDE
jgi:hypothetical protein